MAMAATLDLAKEAVEIGEAALVGGIQRAAWEKSMPMGFMATGVSILGGLFIEMNGAGGMRQFGSAAKVAGATVAGWVIAEKFIQGGSGAHDVAAQAASMRMIGPGAAVPAGARAAVGQKILRF